MKCGVGGGGGVGGLKNPPLGLNRVNNDKKKLPCCFIALRESPGYT